MLGGGGRRGEERGVVIVVVVVEMKCSAGWRMGAKEVLGGRAPVREESTDSRQ